MKQLIPIFLILFSVMMAACQPAATSPQFISVIPKPASMELMRGYVVFPPEISIYAENPEDVATVELLALALREMYDRDAVVTTSQHDAQIVLIREKQTHAEGYRLETNGNGAQLYGEGAGLFYATQTLLQLFQFTGDDFSAPHVRITDAPRFQWRGLHLDVSRHFRSVDFVKKYLDVMALHKLNTFHWHLTDDQGWRIEIKAYPKLTTIGAWRSETVIEKRFNPFEGDGIPHGGFYTQDEVREVVAYAAARHITIVPEIEMPGHAMAAIAAYPELACTPGPFEVAKYWGVFEDVFCPTETTFTFLETVLGEVLELFPSSYIHIGGDEVPKRRWMESAEAQAIIRREGLADEHELQSWFIRRIERFLSERNRTLIGWDEILDGGLAPNAAVMSWRGESGGIQAANLGHNVVMTPNSYLYLDYYQEDPATEPLAIGGFIPLEKVYDYEPVPAALAGSVAEKHILGAQANVWTEYMKTAEHVEYMVFPRAIALAERVWSPQDVRDFDDFEQRLHRHYSHLDRWNVYYRIPEPEGWEDTFTLDDEVTIRLNSMAPGGCIIYTTDGSVPSEQGDCVASPEIKIPLQTNTSATIKAIHKNSIGRSAEVRSMHVSRLEMEGAPVQEAPPYDGLAWAYYEASVRHTQQIDNLEPDSVGTKVVVSTPASHPDRYAQRFEGWMEIPAEGLYTFALTSDDGSVLHLNGREVINNDGLHASLTKTATLALGKGWHALRLRHFDAGGGGTLSLKVSHYRGDEIRPVFRREAD